MVFRSVLTYEAHIFDATRNATVYAAHTLDPARVPTWVRGMTNGACLSIALTMALIYDSGTSKISFVSVDEVLDDLTALTFNDEVREFIGVVAMLSAN
jgi:hypothetical protein